MPTEIQDSQQFPCNRCGSNLSYLPGTQKMQCHHCGYQHQIEINIFDQVEELDYYTALEEVKNETIESKNGKGSRQTEQRRDLVQCGQCAATFPFADNVHADACPYCGSNIVSEIQQQNVITPWGVLPFKISAEEAFQQYKSWLKGLWFAPSKLKRYAKTHEQLNGMYVPYWTFDTRATTHYSGQRGTYYQVPVRYTARVDGRMVTRTKMVTKVRWQPVSGTVRQTFDDVLIYASNTLPKSIAKELEPWDLELLTPYKQEFISGFKSEIYQKGLQQGFSETIERIAPAIHMSVRRDIGGDTQRIHQLKSQHDNIRFRHILLPFWVAGFRFNQKTYQFVVNGRTGEVQGQRPFSKFKIFMLILFLAILTAAGIWLMNESGFLDQLFYEAGFY